MSVYEKQTEHRDTLRQDSKELIADIINQINGGEYDNPKVEELLQKISVRLKNTTAKKVYGYQKADVKNMIDFVVDELERDERIEKLYDLWYEQKFAILKTYTDTLPDKIPLFKNDEFKNIRNAVIKEAMRLYNGSVIFEDDDINDEPADTVTADDAVTSNPEPIEQDASEQVYTDSKSWWSKEYKQARIYLYGNKETEPDFEKALSLMLAEAEKGNGYAMHDYAKMLLGGIGCEKNEQLAQQWFVKAYDAFIGAEQTAEKPGYLQYRIGKLFSFGYGVEQSYESAAEWYEKAVEQQNPFAAYSLGSLYNRGQGVEQDFYQAFTLFEMAATDDKKPNAYAMYELGKMHKDGIGTEQNKTASDQWYKSAYQGFVNIEKEMSDDKLQYRLGQMNLKGIGTKVDLNTAFDYFTKSAKLENADAHYGLGKLYLDKNFEKCNTQKAVEHLIEAAKREHDFAAYTLGKLFFNGDGVAKDVLYGMKWLEYAADKNNQFAQYFLGKEYLAGTELPRDADIAVRYLSKSAEKGNSFAQYKLGKLYLLGEDVPLNPQKAVELLSASAEKGNEQAEYFLGKTLLKGELLPKDISKALELLDRAALKNNQFAQYLLGKFYLTEEDAPKDIDRAVLHLEKAANQGNQYAQYSLGKLYLYGNDVERDTEKSIALLTASAEQGNIYAANLLKSYRHNKNIALGMGTLRLFQNLGKILQNKLEDDKYGKIDMIDKKQRRAIDDKKIAHGLRQ